MGTTEGRYSYTLPVRFDPGLYRLKVTARDGAGNGTEEVFFLKRVSLGEKLIGPVEELRPRELEESPRADIASPTASTIAVPAVSQVSVKDSKAGWLARLFNWLKWVWGRTVYLAQNGWRTLIASIGLAPTRILSVKVDKIESKSAVIVWETNHKTKNNKVNFGTDRQMESHVFADDGGKTHQVTLTNLQPEAEYYFEVMSQGRTYAYDAFHQFTTLP